MTKNSTLAVVIPVHTADLDVYSLINIACNVYSLNSYQVILVSPESVDLSKLVNCLQQINPKLSCLKVDNSWMATIDAYNRMLRNISFYSLFARFHHILICEPDAIILDPSKLQYWIDQEFDFIGAPWFRSKFKKSPVFSSVGNSGLSLIRLDKAIQIFSSSFSWYDSERLIKDCLRSILLFDRFSLSRLRLVLFKKMYTLSTACNLPGINIDFFFHLIHKKFGLINLPTPQVAASFSWDTYPELCYAHTNSVPIGIHKWRHYNYSFCHSFVTNAANSFNIFSSCITPSEFYDLFDC